MSTMTLLSVGRGRKGVKAEISLPYDTVLRCVLAGGVISELLLHHQVYDKEANSALEGLVEKFVLGGGLIIWVS